MFISFEGGEGCGKSTHLGLLAEQLGLAQKSVIATREPGGTSLGIALRQILLMGEALNPRAELLLFASDRAEHIEKVIQPALQAGKIVLCDRFIDSTFAYQIGGRGLPEDMVNYINFISSFGIFPDLTFLLDVPVEQGLQRVKGREGEINRFDKEKLAFHSRVREAYLALARNNPQRFRVIDATQTIEVVHAAIIQQVKLEGVF